MSKRRKSATTAETSPAGSVDLTERQLDQIDSGIALLLPAVQKAREAARKSEIGQTADPTTAPLKLKPGL